MTDDRKRNGVVYTPPHLAKAVVRMAIRSSDERVLDPACGDGAFLACAREVGCHAVGVDVDHSACAAALRGHATVFCEDFLSLAPDAVGCVDAVVGNPPFVRYQFVPNADRLRRQLARESGLRLAGTANYWAYFVVRSVEFLRPGGRLAMVVPLEIMHANYAQPVVSHLASRFANLQIVVLGSRFFNQCEQAVAILRALDYGGSTTSVEVSKGEIRGARIIMHNRRRAGIGSRLALALLPPEVESLYLGAAGAVLKPLGEFATVQTGYVTGDNAFFHCNWREAQEIGLPSDVLLPVVRSSRQLCGPEVRLTQLRRDASNGYRNLLIRVPPSRSVGDLNGWLRGDRARSAAGHHKCRIREPWYSVPVRGVSDFVLANVHVGSPSLVLNTARAPHSNALLGITLMRRATRRRTQMLGLACHNSLTALSAEIEGRWLGGGGLKLEPCDTRRLLVPGMCTVEQMASSIGGPQDESHTSTTDCMVGDIDQALLIGALGLSPDDVFAIAEARAFLQRMRISPSRVCNAPPA